MILSTPLEGLPYFRGVILSRFLLRIPISDFAALIVQNLAL